MLQIIISTIDIIWLNPLFCLIHAIQANYRFAQNLNGQFDLEDELGGQSDKVKNVANNYIYNRYHML